MKNLLNKLIPSNETLEHYWWCANYIFWNYFYTFFFSLRKQGGNNIPKTGPVLLIANHESFLDPISVGLTSTRNLCYLARKTFIQKPLAFRLPESCWCFPRGFGWRCQGGNPCNSGSFAKKQSCIVVSRRNSQ